MHKLIATPAGKVAALVIVLAMCVVAAQAADASQSQARSARDTASAKTVAHNASGHLTSRIAGETGNGRDVTGSFVPLRFVKKNGKVRVHGLVQGVVHNRNGSTSTFATPKTFRVKSLNGTPARADRSMSAQASCDILHLVLGPLDLDLLGLQVHLNRVVLNIVAASGAGNLLGNLLCAVAGLLDGGLGGALGRLVNLLNQILGALRLG